MIYIQVILIGQNAAALCSCAKTIVKAPLLFSVHKLAQAKCNLNQPIAERGRLNY